VKRKAWKFVLGLLGGLGLLCGAFVWQAQSRATQVFERYDLRANQAIAGLRSRVWARPVLFPPAVSGDGWPPYAAALAGFAAIPDAEAGEIPTLNGEPGFQPDLETLEDLFQKYEPLVEQLRESYRRNTFHPGYRYESGLVMEMTSMTQAIRAAKFLADRAIHFHQSGRRAEALESLILGLGVGHDTARGGVIINSLILNVCEGFEEESLRGILKEHEFKAQELEVFAGSLDLLWETRPEVGDTFAADEVVLCRSVADWGLSRVPEPGSGVENGGGLAKRSWRYLFSRRLATAGALGELEEFYGQCRTVSALATPLRAAAMEKVVDARLLSRNPILQSWLPAAGKVSRRDAISQMKWVLMRVSVALAWYEVEKGAAPGALKDLVPRYLSKVPLCALTGLPLGYRPGQVWSPGLNTKDDGGIPGSKDDADDEDGDVVWTVKRK
jgi:hypothetical protein